MKTATVQFFSAEFVDGKKYLTTVYRGTEYTLSHDAFGWGLATRRLGYGGSFHRGGFKRFDSLSALVLGCKAFGDASNVIALAF